MAVIPQADWERLAAPFAAYGVTLLAEHKTALESKLAVFSDTETNAIVSAIASKITAGGIAGLLTPEFRNALVASEPSLDAIVNGNESSAFDAVLAYLQSLASKS